MKIVKKIVDKIVLGIVLLVGSLASLIVCLFYLAIAYGLFYISIFLLVRIVDLLFVW